MFWTNEFIVYKFHSRFAQTIDLKVPATETNKKIIQEELHIFKMACEEISSLVH